VGTTICCPAFTCFVSTARVAFLTANWETAVFEISPTPGADMKLRLRFGYSAKMKRKGGQLIHEIFCSELDKAGESSRKPLYDCVSDVVGRLGKGNAISGVTVY
jgi:hypothetical protein